MNAKFKSATSKSLICLLLMALTLTLLPGIFASAASTEDSFEDQLSRLRSELFSQERTAHDLGRTKVFIDDINRTHMPPEYLVPEISGYSAIEPFFTPVNYTLNSRRAFPMSVDAATNGTLVRQGEHVNIWVLDGTPAISDVDLNTMLARFDDITYRMTRDFGAFRGVRVTTHYTNDMPFVGDVHNDGRVNVLLRTLGSGLSGFFSNGDFFIHHGNTPIALFHMCISFWDINRDFFFETFAHELQHLLFFIHLGVFLGQDNHGDFLWFNEALSELAGKYWSCTESVINSRGRLLDAAENWGYEDFVTFSGLKSYAMSRLHGTFVHRFANDYVGSVYSFFAREFPTPTTAANFTSLSARGAALNMIETVGDIFQHAGLTGSLRGAAAFNFLYFMFMEDFAADGGNIVIDGIAYETTMFINSPYSAFNLWGLRPTLGLPQIGNNNVIVVPEGGGFVLTGRRAFPELQSGFSVSVGGVREKFYRLIGESTANPVLNIQIADSSSYTMFYIVVPNDPPGSVASFDNPHFGRNGATVHPLTAGNNTINTRGAAAYLFVVTLNRGVNATVTYSWSAPTPSSQDLLEALNALAAARGYVVAAVVLEEGGDLQYLIANVTAARYNVSAIAEAIRG